MSEHEIIQQLIGWCKTTIPVENLSELGERDKGVIIGQNKAKEVCLSLINRCLDRSH